MRERKDGELPVGKVCICREGRIGIVTGWRRVGQGTGALFTGVQWDGSGTWHSLHPIVLAESIDEFRQALPRE